MRYCIHYQYFTLWKTTLENSQTLKTNYIVNFNIFLTTEAIFGFLNKHESDKNKKCSSVGNFGILSVVVICSAVVVIVCSTSTAYTSLYRDLKYQLKYTIFYLKLSLSGQIFYFQHCLADLETLYLKKISQK